MRCIPNLCEVVKEQVVSPICFSCKDLMNPQSLHAEDVMKLKQDPKLMKNHIDSMSKKVVENKN